MHKFILTAIMMTLSFLLHAQKPTGRDMRWMNLRDAEIASQQSPRPVIIDLYTDWCGWCKVMDKRTYRNAKVVRYLNEKFYPVKLDAESKSSFTWQGRQYAFSTRYKTNEIALYFTGGQLSYPTTVIIPGPGEAPQAIPGYLSPKELELIVKYYGEGAYKTTTFPEFRHRFKSNW
ncbi:thioredoxin family protein [Flavihumibacter stibioxidans]|nr:DUF255 domain-containing protein [Flavihumibacter stibioxidans]